MQGDTIWCVLDAYEQLIDAYLSTSEAPARNPWLRRPAPAAAMLSLENCMDVFDSFSSPAPAMPGPLTHRMLDDSLLD
jgi:hypothetical protein